MAFCATTCPSIAASSQPMARFSAWPYRSTGNRSTTARPVSLSSLARTEAMTAVQARSEKSAGSRVSTGRGVARTRAATSSSSATQSTGSGISHPSGEMLSRVQHFLSSTSSGATCTVS